MAAKKQISSPSASSSSSSSDDDDSSSDEERVVVQHAPSLKRKQRDSEGEEKESESEDSSSDEGEDEDEDEDEDEEKAKSPATKSVSHPSQAQQSCTEEEKKESVPHPSEQSSEEEETEEEKKESVPHPSEQSSEEEEKEEEKKESVPHPSEQSSEEENEEDAKLKPNWVPGPSPSKTTNAVQRVWSLEDELVLLDALSHYHNTYGKVPSPKLYASFLSGIIGSLTFPATENQLYNKIRTWKTNYGQRKKMGSKAKSLNPHEKVVFKICAKLFEDDSKTKLFEDDAARARCSIYLRELISRQKLPAWLSTVEDVVEQLGESRARDLEAKARQLSIDAMKLHAREEKLKADLFDALADEMVGDG